MSGACAWTVWSGWCTSLRVLWPASCNRASMAVLSLSASCACCWLIITACHSTHTQTHTHTHRHRLMITCALDAQSCHWPLKREVQQYLVWRIPKNAPTWLSYNNMQQDNVAVSHYMALIYLVLVEDGTLHHLHALLHVTHCLMHLPLQPSSAGRERESTPCTVHVHYYCGKILCM